MNDVAALLIADIEDAGARPVRRGDWIELDGLDLLVRPHLGETTPAPRDHRSALVYFSFKHPRLFETGAFEFAWGWANADDDAVRQAVHQWATVDLPALIEAITRRRDRCLAFEFDHRHDNLKHRLDRSWRATVGPLQFVRGDGAHSACCQSCLFSQSIEAIVTVLEDPTPLGVKVFACKNPDGSVGVDFRVNGHDRPEAKALIEPHVRAWDCDGVMELRRTYIVLEPL